MDPIRKIPKKFTKKFGNKVINRQYFCRKTGLYSYKLQLRNVIVLVTYTKNKYYTFTSPKKLL